MSNRHAGHLDAIKSVIALKGPQTVPELVKATKLSDHTVRDSLYGAISRTGGIVHAGKKNNAQLYGLPGIHKPKEKPSPNPRYVYEFKELTPHDHDLYAGRNLALLAR